MKCSNCGSDLRDGLKFCPICGTMISDFQQGYVYAGEVQDEYAEENLENTQDRNYGMYNEKPPANENQYYSEVPPVYRASHGKRKKSVSQKNVWLIVTAVVLAVAIVTVAVLFFVLGNAPEEKAPEKTETYECEICGEETDNEEYCDDCIENFKCEYCDEVSETVVDGFCEDCEVEYTCRACDTVDEQVKDGYCPECLEDMKCKGDNCNEILDEGHYCDDCIKNQVNEHYEGLCFVCDEEIGNVDIFVIDTEGYVYCEDCDTGNYCALCNGYIDEDDDDDVCFFCADYYCFDCFEVLERKEISVTDEYDNVYCEDCDTGYYCDDCGAPIRENNDYCNCVWMNREE